MSQPFNGYVFPDRLRAAALNQLFALAAGTGLRLHVDGDGAGYTVQISGPPQSLVALLEQFHGTMLQAA